MLILGNNSHGRHCDIVGLKKQQLSDVICNVRGGLFIYSSIVHRRTPTHKPHRGGKYETGQRTERISLPLMFLWSPLIGEIVQHLTRGCTHTVVSSLHKMQRRSQRSAVASGGQRDHMNAECHRGQRLKNKLLRSEPMMFPARSHLVSRHTGLRFIFIPKRHKPPVHCRQNEAIEYPASYLVAMVIWFNGCLMTNCKKVFVHFHLFILDQNFFFFNLVIVLMHVQLSVEKRPQCVCVINRKNRS